MPENTNSSDEETEQPGETPADRLAREVGRAAGRRLAIGDVIEYIDNRGLTLLERYELATRLLTELEPVISDDWSRDPSRYPESDRNLGVVEHAREQEEWPQYYGVLGTTDDFVPSYYRVHGPNGPVDYLTPELDESAETTMTDFAMEAQSDTFVKLDSEDTPYSDDGETITTESDLHPDD